VKIATITGRRSAAIVDRPEPRAAGDIVKVQVLVAPTCTEWRQYRDGETTETLGHEAAGVVVDAAGSSRVREGDRIVVMPQHGCGRCALCLAGDHIHCRDQRDVIDETGSETGTATYGQFVIKPDWLLLPVPDDVSLVQASLACCALGPSFGAMERMRVDVLDTVLVSGSGPVGLGALVNAAVRNARAIALEPHPYRARLARALGAFAVVDPTAADALEQIGKLTGGHGADASIETSGASSAAPLLVKATRARGRIAFTSWNGSIEVNDLVGRGLELHGCWHWNHQRDGERMFETIRRAGPLLDRLITHRFPLEEVTAAWEVQLTGECGKVLLFPWGEDAAA
jgi:threonine dehydrogenase-like Zn-dependent dehydrogenase